jgi:hypothetical protein
MTIVTRDQISGRVYQAGAPGVAYLQKCAWHGREIAALADRQAIIVNTLGTLDLVHGAEINQNVVAVYGWYRKPL